MQTADPIEIAFGGADLCGRKELVLDSGPNPPQEGTL